jgi:hypothetical protein
MMLLDAWMMLMMMFSIFNHVVLINFFLGRDTFAASGNGASCGCIDSMLPELFID